MDWFGVLLLVGSALLVPLLLAVSEAGAQRRFEAAAAELGLALSQPDGSDGARGRLGGFDVQFRRQMSGVVLRIDLGLRGASPPLEVWMHPEVRAASSEIERLRGRLDGDAIVMKRGTFVTDQGHRLNDVEWAKWFCEAARSVVSCAKVIADSAALGSGREHLAAVLQDRSRRSEHFDALERFARAAPESSIVAFRPLGADPADVRLLFACITGDEDGIRRGLANESISRERRAMCIRRGSPATAKIALECSSDLELVTAALEHVTQASGVPRESIASRLSAVSPTVRLAALRALVRLWSASEQELLEACRDGSISREVEIELTRALGNVGGPASLAALHGREDQLRTSADAPLRRAIEASIHAIRRRHPEAQPGQLSVPTSDGGALSAPDSTAQPRAAATVKRQV